MLHPDPDMGEMVRRADAGQHQDLGRVVGAARQQHLARRVDPDRFPAMLVLDAYGPTFVEQYPVDQSSRVNGQVRPPARLSKIGCRRALAASVADGRLAWAEAFLIGAVIVIAIGYSGGGGRKA